MGKSFGKWWPELADAVEKVKASAPAVAGAARSDRELLEETLDIARSLTRSLQPLTLPTVGGEALTARHRFRSELEGLMDRNRPRSPDELLYLAALTQALKLRHNATEVDLPDSHMTDDEK